MMMEHKSGIIVCDATVSDALYIAENMRRDDAIEVMASHNHTPAEAMSISVSKSAVAYTVKYRGKIVCMFGANPTSMFGKRATIWLLGTDDMRSCGYLIARHGRVFVDRLLELWPYLDNYVYCKNLLSIRWLKIMGAKFGDFSFGINNNDKFQYFYFERAN